MSNQETGVPSTMQVLAVHELFEAQAAKTPDALAVAGDRGDITYSTLNRLADRYAGMLRARGVQPEVLVGLSGTRSPELVVGLMAILKAGGAYVPLDSSYPMERLRTIVQNSRLSMIVVAGDAADSSWAGDVRVLRVDCGDDGGRHAASMSAGIKVDADNLALVIHTSGSMGEPKGVALTHRAISTRLGTIARRPVRPRICQKASLSLVAHVSDLLAPLLTGVPVLIVDDNALQSPMDFAGAIERYRLDHVMLAPSQLRALLDHPDAVKRLGGLLRVFVSGEAMDASLLHACQSCLPHIEVIHSYGASETVGAVSAANLTAMDRVVTGSSDMGATAVFVMDESLRELPPGSTGELFVRSPQLARGYLNRPALTAERFVPDPEGSMGERLYRTGDLGAWDGDGHLIVTGRQDLEVKIRGLRVFLPDVETRLQEHSAIDRAVVLKDTSRGDDGELVAVVSFTAGGVRCDASELRMFLNKTLAPHMIPSVFRVADRIPELRNGKVDRRQLTAWLAVPGQLPDLERNAPHVSPRTETEAVLTAICAEVLNVPALGIHDDFLELGGDSLHAARVASRILQRYEIRLTARDFFEHGTVEALSRVVDEKAGKSLQGGTHA